MSFADLRQTVLINHALSPNFFGELATIVSADEDETVEGVAVKVEAVPPWLRRQSNDDNERRKGTIDQREWIRVTLCRVENAVDASGNPIVAYPKRPQLGTTLTRDASRDTDPRPYVFRGETVYEGDKHAVYIFERPRRFAQGHGIGT